MNDTAARTALDAEALHERLEALVYMVLSVRRSVRAPALELARFGADDQQRFLQAVERIRRTSDELAYNFVSFAVPALRLLQGEDWDQWLLHLLSRYDQGGVLAAIVAMQKVGEYAAANAGARVRVRFEEVARALECFVLGLNGRALRPVAGEVCWTDTESLYLPAAIGRFPEREANRLLYKAMAVHQWAQTWFGTWRRPSDLDTDRYPDPAFALHCLHLLETLRLDACIERELPGVGRELRALRARVATPVPATGLWARAARRLGAPGATVADSLDLLPRVLGCGEEPPEPAPYAGELNPQGVARTLAARVARERRDLAACLVALERERRGRDPHAPAAPPRFRAVREPAADIPEGFRIRLECDGEALAPRADVQRLLDSIVQDLGELPEEYLVPAGPGGYRAAAPRAEDAAAPAADAGAYRYDEWDFQRGDYRSDWCLLRERDAHPQWDGFVAETRARHAGLLKQLRRSFEAVRGADRRLRRQPEGDDVDLDALVENYADHRAGREGGAGLFVRRRRAERDIAVLFLVDMSGSTKGWVNDVEREALVLLCEALETLGDRYGIYGFSGFTHRRCELYRIKRIDEPYSEAVQARISGIRPRDYTRMGAAIRHLTGLFRGVEARTRLLVTISDGRPDDQDGYRGAYGIEDTRRALIEARACGVHPYCVTIDEEALEYLPHMFGPAGFTVVDDVRRLPYRVADIYRHITT